MFPYFKRNIYEELNHKKTAVFYRKRTQHPAKTMYTLSKKLKQTRNPIFVVSIPPYKLVNTALRRMLRFPRPCARPGGPFAAIPEFL